MLLCRRKFIGPRKYLLIIIILSNNHNEQASTIAAQAYAKRFNEPACVCVSNGPGGTNAVTEFYARIWVLLLLLHPTGQVRYDLTTKGSKINVRSLGEQEANISEIVKPITKYSSMIEHSSKFKDE